MLIRNRVKSYTTDAVIWGDWTITPAVFDEWTTPSLIHSHSSGLSVKSYSQHFETIAVTLLFIPLSLEMKKRTSKPRAQ